MQENVNLSVAMHIWRLKEGYASELLLKIDLSNINENANFSQDKEHRH